ncbi:MAG TPA: hypothetical protein VGD88_01690 [Opitutaceae bacterium]
MLQDSTPPLLRGLGTTVILCATILTFIIAREEMREDAVPAARPAAVVSADVDETDEDTVIEEVLSNPWIEGLSYGGTALISASFYLEWLVRRRKKPAA